MKRRITTIITMVATLAATAVALSGATAAAASGSEARATVYFTRGEQLAPVQRTLGDAGVETALQALFVGPSATEHRAGLRTNIPVEASLRGVELNGGVATVDVTQPFAVGGRASLQARLAQLVFTATAVSGVETVRLAVDGEIQERFGGLIIENGVGRRTFAPVPAGGAPPPPPVGVYSTLVRQIQLRLIALRYLPPGAADGLLGQQTRHAILAYQGWEATARDGRATRALLEDLEGATAPVARAGAGRRIEVSIARQVALLIDGGRVVRAIHVSTGARGFDTPRGSFRVFRKELRSWSYPYRVWLPYASYFTGGVAFHESADVPPYPASHGCVRVPSADARVVYSFANMGTRVTVL